MLRSAVPFREFPTFRRFQCPPPPGGTGCRPALPAAPARWRWRTANRGRSRRCHHPLNPPSPPRSPLTLGGVEPLNRSPFRCIGAATGLFLPHCAEDRPGLFFIIYSEMGNQPLFPNPACWRDWIKISIYPRDAKSVLKCSQTRYK